MMADAVPERPHIEPVPAILYKVVKCACGDGAVERISKGPVTKDACTDLGCFWRVVEEVDAASDDPM